ncbi:acyl carrier protein [Actinocorallia sp. A-T 12471]|uniref:acyl carrier protein n=1 Tax=Actinocorallia sp. A-T 12471 TaxID=3089813 RepID=UPI0029CF1043|nr:phosphopantetheine-binding protein [Actinocorallia sp. A-T 12471]MDX6741526.1 phosphopantetheine-binding protein [Actinocorallia sp. A-T 12471]
MKEKTHSPARTKEVEEHILGWTAELLEEGAVQPGDNFLDLGGHSVLALELIAKVRARFGVELDMQPLFEGSLGEVAARVARDSAAPTERTHP